MAHSGDQDFLDRRESGAKDVRDKAPKSPSQLKDTFMRNALEKPMIGYFTDGPRLRARSTRHKNRTVVVGNTPFIFDSNGLTENAIDQGWARADYNQLLAMNGMTAVSNPTEVPKSGNGVPELIENESNKPSKFVRPPVVAPVPEVEAVVLLPVPELTPESPSVVDEVVLQTEGPPDLTTEEAVTTSADAEADVEKAPEPVKRRRGRPPKKL